MDIDFSVLTFSEEAEALIKFWSSLPRKKGQFGPVKSDFSPVKLGRHLPAIFMFERHNAETLLVRVAGSGLRDHLGQEITGKNLLDLVPSEYKHSYFKYYSNLQSYPCAGLIERPFATPSGGRKLLKTLHLPLLDANGDARFFVGALRVDRLPVHFEEVNSGIMSTRKELKMEHVDLGAGMPGLDLMESEPSCA